MSLLESVKTAFQGKKKSAMEEYRKSLAQGKAVEQVVRLALAAGLTEAEIAADAAVIDKAGALAESASTHPELKKKLDDAAAEYASIEAEYATAVDRFTEQLSAAGEAVEAARAGETPARRAVEELAKLHRDHAAILPPAPPVVRELLGAQDRETQIAESREAVRRARSAAGVIERQVLTAQNEVRTGVTTVSGFNQATLKLETREITQPAIKGIDDTHVASEQGNITQLENRLADATANAQRLADQHATKFNEQVP